MAILCLGHDVEKGIYLLLIINLIIALPFMSGY